jgi:hypothetical protein
MALPFINPTTKKPTTNEKQSAVLCCFLGGFGVFNGFMPLHFVATL